MTTSTKKEKNIMNLQYLNDWAERMKKEETLKQLVRKDPMGAPLQNDMRTCVSLLKEITKRIVLVENHLKTADRFQCDIAEYLEQLYTRGVKYVDQPPEVSHVEERIKAQEENPVIQSPIHSGSDKIDAT